MKKNLLKYVSLSMILLVSLQPGYAQTKAKWVTPASANNIKNPIPGNAASVTEAKKLYTTNCGPCHGDKGKGDGAAAAALNPKPADHTSAAVQSESDGSLFWKLSEGRNPMPSYKTMFTEQQRWGLVNYIRTLKKK